MRRRREVSTFVTLYPGLINRERVASGWAPDLFIYLCVLMNRDVFDR